MHVPGPPRPSPGRDRQPARPRRHLALADVGVTHQDLHRLLARGLVERAHVRVYRPAGAPSSLEATAMAAVLAGGPDAVLARSWAAWLHGVDRVPRTPEPEILRPGRTRCIIAGVKVHATRGLDRCDRTTVRGIPVASGARTAVDLADGGLEEADTLALVDDLICRRATTRRWLHIRAGHLANGRANANIIVRITRPDAEGEFWSWLERRFHTGVVVAFGLPHPVYNVAVSDHRGRIGVADALWNGRRDVVVEVDGLSFHRTPGARTRDRGKGNRYALSGRIPLRFGYADVVGRPELVAEQVRQALDAAGVPGVSRSSSL